VLSGLQLCEQSPRCHREKLVELLMRPAQHIARYTLYLRDLQKSTPPNHPDLLKTAFLIEQFTNILT
jgi:hypothetical protein